MFATDFKGDPNLGLYSLATDNFCIMGITLPRKQINKIKNTLKVPIKHSKFMETDFTGMFIAANSKGMIVSEIAKEFEINALENIADVLILKTKYTTIGNLVLMNDKGIILSPLLKKFTKEVSEFFDLPCTTTKIAGINIIGSLGIATNKGCLLHPKAKKKELEIIKKTLKVRPEIGTVNYGSPYCGAGIVANSFGFITSKSTSGPESGRISEALRLL